jgi:LysR family transcriptional regulator for bpeEF and oprC
MPSALGRMWIVPNLPEFTRSHPSVSLEIVCNDFVPYSIDDGLDVAVQVNELHESRLAVRRLASIRYVTCAAPGYLAARPAPKTPADLTNHACLAYRRPRNGRVREWSFQSGSSVSPMPVNGIMTFNSGETLVAAAAAGLGIVQVAEYYAEPFLESGKLVEVLADRKAEGYDISVVFHKQPRVAPKVRVFVDFLIELFDPPPWRRKTAATHAVV